MAAHSYWRLNLIHGAASGAPYVNTTEVAMHTSIGGSNVCTGGTASASSGTAANAFDGNTSTNWESSTGANAWLKYAFASPVDIVEYTIRKGSFAGEDPIEWQLEFSDDNSSWTVAGIERGINSWSAGETKTFTVNPSSATTPALFWRLNITHTNFSADGYCAIAEVQMHTTVGGSNACTGGPAGAASANSETNVTTSAANKALDVDGTTYWESNTGASSGYWWRYHFASAVDIVEYTIKRDALAVSEAPKTWTLEHSGDGINWTVADTRSSETGWTSGEVRTYTLSGAAALLAADGSVLQTGTANLTSGSAGLAAAGTETQTGTADLTPGSFFGADGHQVQTGTADLAVGARMNSTGTTVQTGTAGLTTHTSGGALLGGFFFF